MIKSGLIILFITLAMLTTGELVLRGIYPEKIKKNTIEPADRKPRNIAYRFNPDYLVDLKPNIEKTFRKKKINGGGTTTWKSNSDGFRGPELQDNPALRIMIYGDSNVQARFSNLEKTYPYRLQEYLRVRGLQDVEVVNAGIIGSGPDQYFLRMTKEFKHYRPDLVIFHIFAENDFGDIIRNRLLELDSKGNLTVSNHPPTIDQVLDPRPTTGSRGGGSLLTSSLLFKAAAKLGRKFSGREKEIYQEKTLRAFLKRTQFEYKIYKNREPRRVSYVRDYYDIDVALGMSRGSSKEKVRLLSAILRTSTDFLKTQDVPLLVVIQPSRTDITHTDYSLNYRFLETQEGYRRSNLTDAVEHICSDIRLNCVNLFTHFRANADMGIYFKGHDIHWTDRGQDIAAEEVADYVLKKNLLPFP